jgi:phosphatidate phosphatase APP1
MARTVFLGNARTRLPFKGVAAFYRALLHGGENASANGEQGRQAGTGPGASTARGVQVGETNPLFYVSSSPWNLYDLLSDFFHIQNIPLGPILFLKDWGFSEDEAIIGHRAYKLKAIRRVMEVYPKLPFILIGDGGQEDPEIYAEVVSLYPQRILAIYIRNVSRDLERPAAIRLLAKKVTEAGSTLILADDTLPMAQHAAAQGWISPAALPEIEAEKQADEAPPSPVEKLLGEEEGQAEAPTIVVDTGNEKAAKKAIDAGAIEEALDTGEKKSPTPPTVVVGDDQELPG